ncbi:MAG: DUF1963 domain-containing protein [Deltaproteobacteria bacterium]|nr:MAG: DUF1963 domain-containing protein [Deltaproteobacteria bacterium]
MNQDGLDDALDQAAAIAAHPEWIRAAARPIVGLLPSTGPASVGRSRLGGEPDLPPGTPWPHHPGGPYRFVAQINFAEMWSRPAELPSKGLLSLFVADDDEQSVFWQEKHYTFAIFTPDPSGLVRHEPPPGLGAQPALAVRFLDPEIDLPRDDVQREDWPDGLAEPLVAWWRQQVTPHGAYLLGYPAVSTLAYDPTPGPEWISLLTLASVEELGWCWHDGDYLHVFIERERLARADFSNLAADAG